MVTKLLYVEDFCENLLLVEMTFLTNCPKHASETDSKVILMGHEIVKLLCPVLVYSKGFFKPILWSCYVRK